MRTPIFVRRVSRQIRDVAGGAEPMEGAVNRDPQGFLGGWDWLSARNITQAYRSLLKNGNTGV